MVVGMDIVSWFGVHWEYTNNNYYRKTRRLTLATDNALIQSFSHVSHRPAWPLLKNGLTADSQEVSHPVAVPRSPE